MKNKPALILSLLLLLSVGIGCGGLMTKKQKGVSDISWKEVDLRFAHSKISDDEKSEIWRDNYKRKVVKWQGELVEIRQGEGGINVLLIKMNEDTSTHDLELELDKAENGKVQDLSKGSNIGFLGTLFHWRQPKVVLVRGKIQSNWFL